MKVSADSNNPDDSKSKDEYSQNLIPPKIKKGDQVSMTDVHSVLANSK
jgi:hypothetical protein